MTKVRWEIFVHLVWGTWDREPIFLPQFHDRVFALMRKKAEESGCEILAVGGIEDHIHVLVSLAPKCAIPDLVKNLKGGSSHLINQELNPGSPIKWQGGYGAFSVSKGDLKRTAAYIRNQGQHHAENTLVGYYESWTD